MAVAVRAFNGGTRWDAFGARIEVKKRGCGVGRPWEVRAFARDEIVAGCAMLFEEVGLIIQLFVVMIRMCGAEKLPY